MENMDIVWTEKYRPRTLDSTILPADTRTKLKNLIQKPQNMPNLLFSGTAGIGKTTSAKAMMNEIDADYLFINASKEGNIDTLRVKIQDFASKVSFSGGRKFVILDEADYLNRQSTQPALRNFMEEYAKNCGFILTCNFKNNLIEPLHSRLAEVPFKATNAEKASLMKQAILNVFSILEKENVPFDRKVVGEHVKRYFPDLRKTLGELQFYSNKNGTIDVGILNNGSTEGLDELIAIMKSKKFMELVTWSQKYDDIDIGQLNSKFLAKAEDTFGAKNLPMIILHLNEGDYKDKFVTNKSINILSMMTEIMRDMT